MFKPFVPPETWTSTNGTFYHIVTRTCYNVYILFLPYRPYSWFFSLILTRYFFHLFHFVFLRIIYLKFV